MYVFVQIHCHKQYCDKMAEYLYLLHFLYNNIINSTFVIMELGVVLICLVLSAIFSGIEIAFFSANRLKVELA